MLQDELLECVINQYYAIGHMVIPLITGNNKASTTKKGSLFDVGKCVSRIFIIIKSFNRYLQSATLSCSHQLQTNLLIQE